MLEAGRGGLGVSRTWRFSRRSFYRGLCELSGVAVRDGYRRPSPQDGSPGDPPGPWGTRPPPALLNCPLHPTSLIATWESPPSSLCSAPVCAVEQMDEQIDGTSLDTCTNRKYFVTDISFSISTGTPLIYGYVWKTNAKHMSRFIFSYFFIHLPQSQTAQLFVHYNPKRNNKDKLKFHFLTLWYGFIIHRHPYNTLIFKKIINVNLLQY